MFEERLRNLCKDEVIVCPFLTIRGRKKREYKKKEYKSNTGKN